MINKNKFFEKNRCCSICGNELSLYLSINNIGTFKCHSKSKKTNKYSFYPLKDQFFKLNSSVSKNDYIKFNIINDIDFNVSVSSETFFNIIKNYHMYFFYICNLEAFNSNYSKNINSYQLDPVKSCYYQCTNNLYFKVIDNKNIISLDKDNILRQELFFISKEEQNYTKNCGLHYDFISNTNTFFYIKSDDNEEKDTNFSKTVDLLDYYLDFSNKEKIIEKFETYILLS